MFHDMELSISELPKNVYVFVCFTNFAFVSEERRIKVGFKMIVF